MEYTENYHLPQWEPTDRVLREDFTGAMSDIDDALKANADSVTDLANRSRFTKLKEFTSTEASSFLEIYLNDIDWAVWDKVHVDIHAPKGGNYYFYVTDAEAGSEHSGYISCSGINGSWAPRMTFHVGFRADRTLEVTCGSNRGPNDLTYSQLVKMVYSGAIMPSGAYYIFWGEK